MTYECRNGVKTGSSSYAMIHCDISSTSSDDEDVRMLRELKGKIYLEVVIRYLNSIAPSQSEIICYRPFRFMASIIIMSLSKKGRLLKIKVDFIFFYRKYQREKTTQKIKKRTEKERKRF